jgi:hypothetical protein
MPTSSSSLPHPLVDPPAEEEIAGLDLRRLDPNRIVTTLKRLERRIDERFPSSSLAAVAGELLVIARECRGRLRSIARPNWVIRVLAALGAALVLTGLVAAFVGLRLEAEPSGLIEMVQGLEAAINDIVFLAIGLFFLFTLEGRLKRRKVLIALHELRSLAHIVDMHQLTKDPEHVLSGSTKNTASSPRRTMSRFELSRYLNYCSELLSLVGKVASLHGQDLRDPVILAAVNDVESLTVGLSRKIWQKIMILDEIGAVCGGGEALPGEGSVA